MENDHVAASWSAQVALFSFLAVLAEINCGPVAVNGRTMLP
jgi:hypothetical protein